MTFVLGTSVVLAACVPPADQSAESRTNPSALSGAPENGVTRAERQQAADRDYELKAQGLANEDKRLTQQQKANEAKDLLNAQTAEENAKVNLDRQAKDLEGRKYDADADVRSADLRASAQRYQADKQYSTMNKVIESAGPVMTAMAAINSAAAESKRADAAEKREDSRVANDALRAQAMLGQTENERLEISLRHAQDKSPEELNKEIAGIKQVVDDYKADVVSSKEALLRQRADLSQSLAAEGTDKTGAEAIRANIARIDSDVLAADRAIGQIDRHSSAIGNLQSTPIGFSNAIEARVKAEAVYGEFNKRPGVKDLVAPPSTPSAPAAAPTPNASTSPTTGINGGGVTPPGNTTDTSELLCFSTEAGTSLGSGCDEAIYREMVDLISKPSAILASGASLQTNDLTEAKKRATDAVNQFYTTQRNSFESFLEQQRVEAEKAGDPKAGAKATNTMNRYDAAVEQRVDKIRTEINNAQNIDDIERLLRDKGTPVLDPQAFAGTAGPSASGATTGMRFQPGDKYLNPQVMMASADPGENSAQSFGLNNQSPAFELGGQGTCELLGATKKC